jgi:hypothetical protein
MTAPMPLLLVTGSRALADTPASEAWARAVLEPAIGAVILTGWLVVGDAPGPDTWAWDSACGWHEGAWAIYGLDGTVVTPKLGGLSRWHADAVAGRAQHGARWPLERNRAMVAAVAKAHRGGRVAARCLALVAPWATTAGTQFTARLAREAGLAVETLTCDAALGPGGAT